MLSLNSDIKMTITKILFQFIVQVKENLSEKYSILSNHEVVFSGDRELGYKFLFPYSHVLPYDPAILLLGIYPGKLRTLI